jgi:hypothetical protein
MPGVFPAFSFARSRYISIEPAHVSAVDDLFAGKIISGKCLCGVDMVVRLLDFIQRADYNF